MRLKYEHTIIPLSVVIGLLFWVAAAAVDSFLSAQVSFLDSLLYYDVSPLKHFVRLSIFSGFVLFGILTHWMLKKQRKNLKQYRELVELSNDIVTIADREGKCVYLNAAACRILERTPEEVIGRSFMEFWHHEDRKKYLKRLDEQAKLNTDTFTFEGRYITKRGRTINVVLNVRVLKDTKGTIIGTQSLARDNTEFRQSEEARQKAVTRATDELARSESLLASMGDGISILSRDLKVLYHNKAYEDLFGGDKRGTYCYQTYPPGDSLCPGCPLESVFEDGENHILEKELSGNGEIRFLEIKAFPMRDASGTIVAGIETVRDITEHKSTEAKMRMFSVAIDDAMDGIQIVDLEGHIVYANKAVQDMFDLTHEELVGKHISELHADHGEGMQDVIRKIGGTSQWSGELSAVHKDGRTFPILFSLSVVRGEHGRPIAMIGTLQDITERKQAEELVKRHHEQLTRTVEERTRELLMANEKLHKEMDDRGKIEQDMLKSQKDESLGTLAGGIAHDFNNLLTAITGYISLAMSDLKPEDRAYQKLERAEKASRRAKDLTRQLLTFSKDGTPVKKTAAVGDLIREVTGFMLRDPRIKLFFSLPADLQPVDVDKGQISQVLHNLLINADHAMPQGGTITISCENEVVTAVSSLPLGPGNYVRINVRDHGVGISQANLSKIFDPYFTTKQEGSGLGLATSYSIIRQHGGHIYAESERGSGTTFVIYLPASSAVKMPTRTSEIGLLTGYPAFGGDV
jgi:PAS domain S-box-containing protein